ncbi:MAG: helix-turn-helix domain-containing protein [Pikeienuella sp.]|uniref:helix-turn-helix domain-containing protein n=1 Tax=Pikeienuella sp. TaxID=2831957 RepID=UPI00391CD3CF
MEGFGDELRSWRKARRLSQMGLAAAADVSARHIACIETGKARPSAEMVARLAEALALPLPARNRLLARAGFAPRWRARDWPEAEMAPVRAAIRHMLESHAPFPGLAVDRLWRILALNGPARALFGPLGIGEGADLLALMVSGALAPHVENWPEVARHAALRLRSESAAQGGAPELDHAAERLAAEAGPGGEQAGPVIPVILRAGGARLSLFAALAAFATPADETLEDLRIELYFPADPETEAALRAAAAG